jgi:SAM-dependent methyltransferase
LQRERDHFRCSRVECGVHYPDAPGGIPILIDERTSIFTFQQFLDQRATFFRSLPPVVARLRRLVPEPGENRKAPVNYARMKDILLEGRDRAVVLVLGGSVLGAGMEALVDPRIELVETDVSLGPRNAIVCDAHQIPFAGATFDGVVSQAVLEHVLDPVRCVAEIHRILKPQGVVYAETPFMQQVHGGAYDFTRFSLLGHRRLFRNFSEVASGVISGPATAFAWAWEYLLVALLPSARIRGLVRAFARFSSALPMRLLDRLIVDRDASADGAAGIFFLGRRSDSALPDQELIRMYRGTR